MDSLTLLRSRLTEFAAVVRLADPDRGRVQNSFLQLQRQFQVVARDRGMEATVQPVLTEISRTLRLIGVDLAFLQASRQPVTLEQRQSQLDGRLTQLGNWLDYLCQPSSQ
ncbi:MAG: heterocyst frequency control protein PatD [Nodosilinea sp. LVE1205-7]